MRGQLIKRYFITGLLIWVPLAITAWVLALIASVADQSLRLLPETLRPHQLLGYDIPGAGVVLTLLSFSSPACSPPISSASGWLAGGSNC